MADTILRPGSPGAIVVQKATQAALRPGSPGLMQETVATTPTTGDSTLFFNVIT